MTGESEKIAAALASIDEYGSLDQLAISTSAKAALVDFTLRQNLIAWSKRHGKYELTRLGRRRLAKGAVATPPVSAAHAAGIALAATLVVITGAYTMWPRPNPPLASRASASLGSASGLSRPDRSPASTTASPQDRDAQTSVQTAAPGAPADPADAGKATAGLPESANFALPAATPPTATAAVVTEAVAPEAEPKSEPELKSAERRHHKRSRRDRQDVADRDAANDPSGTRRSRSNSGERFGFFPFGPFSPDRRSARLWSPF
jgi:hypothetical protein